MKKVDLAYMAGILDGEGCIQITKWSNARKNPSYKPGYGLVVKVGMADKCIPLFFQFAFGGNFFPQHPVNPEYKWLWYWHVSGNHAIECLKILLPYLKSKRLEAELAIKFWDSKRHKGGGEKGRWGNYPKTEEQLAIEEASFILMKDLKNKEVVPY